MVTKQGQAAEAANTSGHLLHIILGRGHCGGVGAQRSDIIIMEIIIVLIHVLLIIVLFVIMSAILVIVIILLI